MNMSLTKADIATVAELISTAIKRDVPPIVEQIVERVVSRESDHIMQTTAVGFTDVAQRFNEVDAKFERIDGRFVAVEGSLQTLEDQLTRVENKQTAETERTDNQSLAIARLNRELGLL